METTTFLALTGLVSCIVGALLYFRLRRPVAQATVATFGDGSTVTISDRDVARFALLQFLRQQRLAFALAWAVGLIGTILLTVVIWLILKDGPQIGTVVTTLASLGNYWFAKKSFSLYKVATSEVTQLLDRFFVD